MLAGLPGSWIGSARTLEAASDFIFVPVGIAAGLLVPLIVWLASSDEPVPVHGTDARLEHLGPKKPGRKEWQDTSRETLSETAATTVIPSVPALPTTQLAAEFNATLRTAKAHEVRKPARRPNPPALDLEANEPALRASLAYHASPQADATTESAGKSLTTAADTSKTLARGSHSREPKEHQLLHFAESVDPIEEFRLELASVREEWKCRSQIQKS